MIPDPESLSVVLWSRRPELIGQKMGQIQCVWVPGRNSRRGSVQVHWVSKNIGVLEFIASFDGKVHKVGSGNFPKDLVNSVLTWYWIGSVMAD